MKKWYLPLAVLGAGSMGALLVSDVGRRFLDRVSEALADDARQLNQWNDAAEQEFESIQKALDGVAEMLGVRGAAVR